MVARQGSQMTITSIPETQESAITIHDTASEKAATDVTQPSQITTSSISLPSVPTLQSLFSRHRSGERKLVEKEPKSDLFEDHLIYEYSDIGMFLLVTTFYSL